MRRINELILHCSGSDHESHDKHALKHLYSWHVLEREWSDIGYHYVISKTKGLEIARPIYRVGSHTRGRNNYSIGIALCGKDDFDESQFLVLHKLIDNLLAIFDISPRNILGHCEIDKYKTCPNFDVVGIRAYFIDLYGE
jgi:N-acetyl-anhydromuramyl-L-alanine amidase AmpD